VVRAHLDQCAQCRRVFAELGDVNVALKGIVAPIVLGPAAVAYLASPAGKGPAGAWIAGRRRDGGMTVMTAHGMGQRGPL